MKTLLEIFHPKPMKIKALRKHLRLTQVEFAEKLGTSQMTIHRWEKGKCPTYIKKLAELALKKHEL